MWRLLPVVISYWLLAAHFFRHSVFDVALLLVCLPLLLKMRSAWISVVMGAGLLLNAAIWCLVTYDMLSVRLVMGESWGRLLFIMGGVICFTLLSAVVFQSDKVRAYYSSIKATS